MSKQQQNNKNNTKSRPKPLTLTQLNAKVQSMKPEDYTKDQAIADFKNKTEMYTKAKQFLNENPVKQSSMNILLARKLHGTILKELGPNVGQLSNNDRKILDLLLLEDDFTSTVKTLAASAGRFLQPYIRPAISAVAPQLMPVIEALMPTVNQQEGIKVNRRYLLTDVRQLFANTTSRIDVNPGLTQFGQWLSIVARAYQFYKIHKLAIEFISSTSLNVQGNVSYYLEMDKNAPMPAPSEIGQQYKSTVHALYQNSKVDYSHEEIHQMVKRFHIRNEDTQPEELSMYDAGTFYYALSTAPGDTVYGQFYIDIEVSFHIPTLQGLIQDYVSQWWSSSFFNSSIQFPFNQIFKADPNENRVVFSEICNGYVSAYTGRIYCFVWQRGTNGNATSSVNIAWSDTKTSTLTYGLSIQNWSVSTAGNQASFQLNYLDVKSGQRIYFAKSSSNEAFNGNTLIAVSTSPNFLPGASILSRDAKEDFKRAEQQKNEEQVRSELDMNAQQIRQLKEALAKLLKGKRDDSVEMKPRLKQIPDAISDDFEF